MPTKSEVMYQGVLYTKELIKEISIKHYDQARYAEIVDEIFNKVFLCDAVDRVGLEKSVKAQVILCSDNSPCEYQTDEEGEPLN